MASADYLRTLVEYNEWANNRVLEAASLLSEDDLRRSAGTSVGSALQNLRHILSAQMGWLSFWEGRDRERAPELPQTGAPAWLRQQFEASHQRLRRFAESVSSDDAERIMEAASDDRPYSRPLWGLMVHVVNHGTQHRSETAVALTAMGSSPGDLDYGHFIDIRSSRTPGTLEMVRALYGYTEWANGKILDAMDGLSDQELMRPGDLGRGSMGTAMLHVVAAQVGWLSIWQGGTPRMPLPAEPGRSFLGNLVDWFGRSHRAIDGFILSLEEGDLGSERIDNPHGSNPAVKTNRSLPLWDMMVHVFNHGTQHRSEVAMALTAMDRPLGDLDFVDYQDMRLGSPPGGR